MKTNIRLFVPTTTEALDFEYGLLIHYMTYNEAKARSEISLDYYELAAVDPMTNALDIVERKEITEAARGQSKIDGFTLDNHYTLSFDQRYNNKIADQNVRQVWLWLHCNETSDYDFLVEKFSAAEEKLISRNNQIFARLWAHDDWRQRDINPLKQQTVSGRIGLVTLLTQQLAIQFEQIEQENRKKALAAIQAAQPQPAPPTPVASAVPVVIAAAPSSTTAAQPAHAVPAVPTVSAQNIVPKTSYPQLIPPPQTAPAKSKTWIWVVAACVIGLPLLVLLGQSNQTEQPVTYDDSTAAAGEDSANIAMPAPMDSAVSTETVQAETLTPEPATDQSVQDKPPIIVGLQWHSKTTDYRDPRGSYDDVAYQITGHQDGVVLIDKTITARPESKVTLMYDDALNLIGGKTGRYVPALANYDWPLVEGKTWSITSEVIGNQYKDLQESQGVVLGKETIATPMGDVEATKVVVTHTAYLAGVEVSRGQDISWYVPELGRAVRTDETYWDTETQAWVVGRKHEMTSFTLP